jgi:CubicO group peptidase (beta-lactamase class C family)
MRRFKLTVLIAALLACLAPPAPAGAASCADPGLTWQRHAPADLALDAARLQQALDWATTHTSATVGVYRHGCLAGETRLDPLTSELPLDGWSMTKSVTSMVVGRAVTLGLFDIDRPLGALYPEADPAHAALTPRHLLTMTAGLHVNWVRDLSPQPDRVADALSLPFDHEPGTHWAYAQSTVTLLANAVERAVGEDLQDFAHEQLFSRIGIKRTDWIWERDRAGHTEGWAHLHMHSRAWARLGQLMLRAGAWNGTQLISRDYLRHALKPQPTNKAYGFLFWRNGGGSYVLSDVEGPDEGTGPIIQSAPRDVFLMAGNGEQRTYVIPSRDMVIVRLGENGSVEGDTRVSVFTGRGGELDYELVRRVMLAVTDVRYGDPGPYPGSDVVLPPLDDGLVGDAQETDHVLAGLGL